MGFKKDLSLKEFIRFLLPSIAVMAFMSTYAIVDGYFISKYAGSDALAAVNLILPINSIIFSVGLMFAAGGGAFAAIKLGQGDEQAASKFFSNLMTVSIGFGVLVMALALVIKEPVMSFLGVTNVLKPYASVYSTFAILTLPFLISKMIFAGFLRASGKPDVSLKMSIIGGLVNMVLDYVFIAIMGMGVAGAGLGTMFGMISALIYASKYFASDASKIKFKLEPIDFALIWETMINGSSEMVSELAIGFTTLVLNTLTIKYLGEDGVAAIAVILYINFFASMIYQGIAIGVSPLLSFHYGAKNFKTLAQIRKYTKYTLFFVSIGTTFVVFANNEFLVSIFFQSGNNAHTIAASGLTIVSFAYLLMGSNMYGSAMYTAFSNGKVSAIISFSKTFIIFAAAAYMLPKSLGPKGIWLILPVTEFITGFLVFYLTSDKQLQRLAGLEIYAATDSPDVEVVI